MKTKQQCCDDAQAYITKIQALSPQDREVDVREWIITLPLPELRRHYAEVLLIVHNMSLAGAA